MAQTRHLRSTFSSGVLKDSVRSRADIQHYHDGLLIGDNIDIQVVGGAKVRPGQRYRHQCLSTVTRAIPFVFNRTTKYLLLFSSLRMQVLKDGVLQTNLNGSGDDFIATPYTTAQVGTLDFTQAYNSMLLFHPDARQQLLFRGASDTDWTIGPVSFENTIQEDYDDASSPTPTTHDVTITFGGTWVTGERYVLELNDFDTPTIHYTDNQTHNARRIRDALLKLPPTGFRKAGIVVTASSLTVYRIQFSGDSAEPYENITGYSVDTDGNKISQTTTTATGVSRKEDAFSTTRGYPACGAFFGSGLWQAGLRSLPQRFIRSVIGDFFNLDIGRGFDDEAISSDLDTDQYNGIRFLHPGRHLIAFTDGGEFYWPQRPITPDDGIPLRQTRYGCGDVKPVELDAAVLFPTRNNRTIREFLFTEIEQAYNASSMTPLSGEAVIATDISSMAGQDGFGADEASRLYVSCEDGNLAALNTKRDQDMAAWSRYTTLGEYRQAVVVDDQVYYLVARDVDGSEVLYVEQRDETLRMDCAITGSSGTPTDAITGLDHLEGREVRILADGIVQANRTVAGGAITLERAASAWQIGLDYNPDVAGTNLVAELGDGSGLGRTESLAAVYVIIKDSNGIEAGLDVTNEQGEVDYRRELIPEWIVSSTMLNAPPTPQNGIRKVRPAGNVEQGCRVRFTQSDPHPFHILGYLAVLESGE